VKIPFALADNLVRRRHGLAVDSKSTEGYVRPAGDEFRHGFTESFYFFRIFQRLYTSREKNILIQSRLYFKSVPVDKVMFLMLTLLARSLK
jgi:hypothetical protein